MRQIPVILIATLLAIPAAGATWFAYGTYEPDTAFDQNGPMWKDADTTVGGKKVYFNVFQTSFGAGTSINNGLTGSRYQQAGAQQFTALLGPWVDCNGDDAIGLEESALLVYPTELLTALGDDTCPVGSPQNDGDWVYEHISIGYDPRETPQNKHPRQIDDPAALVWGDIGFPGFAATGSCPISPFPHGTTAGSGWAIRYLDCFTSNRVQNTINANDPTPGGQLKWDCPPSTADCAGNPQKSDSILNVNLPESLFGNPETGETGTLQLDSEEDGGDEEAAFTTWDCSSRAATVNDNVDQEVTVGLVTVGSKRVIVADPTFNGQNGVIFGNYGKTDENFTEDGTADEYAWVARPAPAVIDHRDSAADGLNQTFRGFRIGGGDEAHDFTAGGDCNTDRDASGKDGTDGENTYSSVHQTAFFRADSPFEPPSQSGKKATDEIFIYRNGGEQEGLESDLFGPNTPSGIITAPATNAQPRWVANTLWATTPQAVNRNTLQPNAPAYWSFYAKVGAETTLGTAGYVAPPLLGASGKYASEACGGATSGVQNGWNCNAAEWNTDSSGNPILPNLQWKAKAHDVYQFRDVDCFDGSIARGAGVFASLVQLSPGVDEDRNAATPNTFVCQDSTI